MNISTMKRMAVAVVAVGLVACCGEEPNQQSDVHRMGLKGNVKTLQISGDKTNITYFFDPQGNKVEEQNQEVRTTYTYLPDENTTQAVSYLKDNQLLKTLFKLDADRNVIQETTYLGEDLVAKVLLKYDDKGNNIQREEYDMNGALFSKTLRTFNTNNYLTQEDIYMGKASGYLWRWTYTYNNKGLVAQQQLYNAQGKLTETRSYTYTYDQKGNVLTEKEHINGLPATETTQMIEYY